MDEQLAFLKLMATRLAGAGIPYMVTGSMALAVYAVPRMTRDIDLVVEVQTADVGRLVGLFAADCYIDETAVRDAVARRGMFNIIHNEWILKADFIVRKAEPYREVELARRRSVDIDGCPVSVVAPEDLLLSKLCWGRESGSELQRRDVEQLVRSAPGLDWDYLAAWAAKLGVGDLLEAVRPT